MSWNGEWELQAVDYVCTSYPDKVSSAISTFYYLICVHKQAPPDIFLSRLQVNERDV